MTGNNVKYVYKPKVQKLNSISAYNTRVTFRNSEGKTVSGLYSEHTCSLPKALSSLVSGKNPNVKKDALLETLWKCSESMEYGNDTNTSLVSISLDRAEKLIDFYADKISEGEPKGVITQSEQFKMMEYWHNWFSKK